MLGNRPRALGSALIVCALGAGPPGVRAAPVQGVVQFPDEPPRRGAYSRVPNGALPIAAPLVDPRTAAVVVLSPDPPKADGEAPKVEARVQGQRLSPPLVVAPPGAALTLRNEDRRPLPLTLRCPGAPPLEATVPAGGEQALTLPTLPPQTLCALRSPGHGPLSGAVLLEHAPAGRVAADGSFRVDVPEGTYQARVYWQGLRAGPNPVTVGATGTAVTLSLRGARPAP